MSEKETLSISDQAKKDLQYIVSQSKNGQARHMDLSNEQESRFYYQQLENCGITADKFPQTHKTVGSLTKSMKNQTYNLSSVSSETDEASPVNLITQIVTEDGQNYYTDALSSVPGGTISTLITIGLYDMDMNILGPLGMQTVYNSGTQVSVNTTGSFATPMPEEGREILSLATIQYTNSSGEQTLMNVVSSTFNFPSEINNISPVDLNHDGQIKVCLNRQGSDCDYYNTSSVTNPVEIPIQGNIVYFSNIDVDANNYPINATNVLQLVNAVTGGDPLVPPAGFNFFTDPKTIISGNTISWDLGWVDFTSTYFGGGTQVYYIFIVTVQTAGVPVTTYITNAPSSLVPGQTSYNTTTLPMMVVVNGCLSADTMITMADKSMKAISEIEVGEKVVSNRRGTVLTVTDTIKGTEQDPMFRIMYDKTKSLLITGGHPVLTNKGVRLAKELQKGDKIKATHGFTTVTSITKENYDGMVYNLNVGTPGDKNLNESNTTFIADGIVVGDGRMQNHFGKQHVKKKSVILKNIPKSWHKDYLNSLKLK